MRQFLSFFLLWFRCTLALLPISRVHLIFMAMVSGLLRHQVILYSPARLRGTGPDSPWETRVQITRRRITRRRWSPSPVDTDASRRQFPNGTIRMIGLPTRFMFSSPQIFTEPSVLHWFQNNDLISQRRWIYFEYTVWSATGTMGSETTRSRIRPCKHAHPWNFAEM